MIRINLIPYRPEKRKQEFQIIVAGWGAALVLAILITVGVNFYFISVIEDLEADKKGREQQIVQLDKQLGEIKILEEKRRQVETRLNAINNLKKDRKLPLHVMDDVSNAIPDKVWITSLTTKKNKIILVGTAQSNSEVAEFMDNLERSPYFGTVELTRVALAKIEDQDLKNFTLDAVITSPNQPEKVVKKPTPGEK